MGKNFKAWLDKLIIKFCRLKGEKGAKVYTNQKVKYVFRLCFGQLIRLPAF